MKKRRGAFSFLMNLVGHPRATRLILFPIRTPWPPNAAIRSVFSSEHFGLPSSASRLFLSIAGSAFPCWSLT